MHSGLTFGLHTQVLECTHPYEHMCTQEGQTIKQANYISRALRIALCPTSLQTGADALRS